MSCVTNEIINNNKPINHWRIFRVMKIPSLNLKKTLLWMASTWVLSWMDTANGRVSHIWIKNRTTTFPVTNIGTFIVSRTGSIKRNKSCTKLLHINARQVLVTLNIVLTKISSCSNISFSTISCFQSCFI